MSVFQFKLTIYHTCTTLSKMIEFNSIREHLNREMEHKYITKHGTRLVHFVESFCNLFCFEKLEINLNNNENVLFFIAIWTEISTSLNIRIEHLEKVEIKFMKKAARTPLFIHFVLHL